MLSSRVEIASELLTRGKAMRPTSLTSKQPCIVLRLYDVILNYSTTVCILRELCLFQSLRCVKSQN